MRGSTPIGGAGVARSRASGNSVSHRDALIFEDPKSLQGGQYTQPIAAKSSISPHLVPQQSKDGGSRPLDLKTPHPRRLAQQKAREVSDHLGGTAASPLEKQVGSVLGPLNEKVVAGSADERS
jgi:hypothetical protein